MVYMQSKFFELSCYFEGPNITVLTSSKFNLIIFSAVSDLMMSGSCPLPICSTL